MVTLIRYAIEVESRWSTHAEYALRLLFESIGIRCCKTAFPAEADVVYSPRRPRDLAEDAVWIPAAPVTDWDAPVTSLGWWDEMPVLGASQEPAGVRGDASRTASDIVYATYALVTGALERNLRRDLVGVPVARSGDSRLVDVFRRPTVAMYCRHLSTILAQRKQTELDCLPHWPDGKKYAVVLTHDVDAPFSRAPWGYYGRRVAAQLSRGAMRAATRGLLQGAKAAALTRFASLPAPEADPNFCFERWREFEGSLSARSCFYVSTINSADRAGAAIDVTYDFRHPEIVAQLRQSAERGWEIGLQASTYAHRFPGRVHEEREMLESVLDGHTVSGVRHHYWALDPEVPERTMWLHAGAGLTYDSSLGFNDMPGFRRGMAWPFQPFDRERSEAVPLLELPPTLMDGSIFYQRVSAEDGRRGIEAHLDEVRSVNGAAVLDWHLEQLNPARLNGAGAALLSVLTGLAADSDVWWATPDQLVTWWKARRDRLTSDAAVAVPL